jgi:glutathione peroxidase
MKRIKSIAYFFGSVVPILLFSSCGNRKSNSSSSAMQNSNISKNFYEFKIKALTGDSTIAMSDYKGKKILIVNVASKCGFTPQYEGLEKLYEKYKNQLVVIGFPCNQFMGQEPGTSEDIQEFCRLTYGVSFPMASKVDVLGKNQHPIYQWLTSKEFNDKDNYKVSWNFNKFLLNEEGKLIAHFGSKTKPLSEEITSLL